MPKKHHKIALHLEQVRSGEEYKGTLTVDGKQFVFLLTFTEPLPKLNELIEVPEDFPQYVRLTLSRSADSPALELPEVITDLLFGSVVHVALNLFSCPVTHLANALASALSAEYEVEQKIEQNESYQLPFNAGLQAFLDQHA